MTPTPILTPKLEPHQMHPSSDYGLLSSENLQKVIGKYQLIMQASAELVYFNATYLFKFVSYAEYATDCRKLLKLEFVGLGFGFTQS